MLWPNGTRTKPRVGGRYGDDRGGRKHAGTDFIGYKTLKAIAAGRVTFAGYFNEDAGWAVVVDSVIEGRTATICRFHPEAYSQKVKKGDWVAEGQALAVMGDTGNAKGKCDHVEIRFWSNGKFTTVDPEVWLAARVNTGGFAQLITRLIPTIEQEHDMRVIFNKDAPATKDTTRRAVVSDLVFKVVTGPQSARERKLWGKPVNFTQGEWDAQLVSVEENRRQLGLPSLATTLGTGITQAALDAAVARIIAAIPTEFTAK